MKRKKIIAGNWKMNHTITETSDFITEFKGHVSGIDSVDIILCPTFTSLQTAVDLTKNTNIAIGAQNVHWNKNGAFTGEISLPMLQEIPVVYVILGHSERRQYFGETNDTVNMRLQSTLDTALKPIVCIGEKLSARESGVTEEVISCQLNDGLNNIAAEQMNDVIIAYEPVWAIGTGVTATPEQAQEVHAFIRNLINKKYGANVSESVRIQYGGSVKSKNADELLTQPDIDGALVGGASLDCHEFVNIIRSAE